MFSPRVGKIPQKRKRQPAPVFLFLSGEFHGQRSLVSYSPWGRRESDTTERLHWTELWTSGSPKVWALYQTQYTCCSDLYRKCSYLLPLFVCTLSGVWLFATPWTIAHQAPLSVEFSRQEYWSGLTFPPPGESSQPRDQTHIIFLYWQADSLPLSYQRSPKNPYVVWKFKKNFKI